MIKVYTVRVLYGEVDACNYWTANVWLNLTTEQQIEENRKNGYFIYQNARGVYKLRRRLPHIVKRNGTWEGYDNRQAALDAEWPMVRNDDFKNVCQTMRLINFGKA